MIGVENLYKSFASQVLFEGASFKLNPKERIGLVGLNGHGKTTLFRIIIGEESPDARTISVPKHYRIGYVRQHLDFTKDTVLKEGMTLAIEPMVNAGGWRTRLEDDGWTVVTTDGSLSAHFEHTIAITQGEPEILTTLN